MLDWLKNINKEYPVFWKEYLAKFDSKPRRFVVMSSESSGTNPVKDVLYAFGAIAVIDNKAVISDSFEAVMLQYKFLHDQGLSNDFLIKSELPKMTEPQAIEAFINYIGNSVLVGHRIHLVVDMINEALEKLYCGRLKNEALDIEIMHRKLNDLPEKPYPQEDLYKFYKIPTPGVSTVVDDAYNLALIFLKLKAKLGIN